MTSYIFCGKVIIIHLIAGYIKKISLCKKIYFPEPCTSSEINFKKVKIKLANYAAKSDLKNTTGVVTLHFAKKVNLSSLKPDIEKLVI